MGEPINPLFANPFSITERNADGNLVTTGFDGVRFGQKIEMPVGPMRAHIQEQRTRNRETNGMSKDGIRRKIADIPSAVFGEWVREYGQAIFTDHKLLKRLIRQYGFGVVAPGSY